MKLQLHVGRFDSDLSFAPSDNVLEETLNVFEYGLVPKDKVGPVKLDRIRPISLYEVTRKLWTGIINDRITKVWESQRALHPSQYGYRPRVGTESEIIQLLNIIADAAETNKTFFLMGFDTKKAFDTVNKDLLRAAWVRLGIPVDIANYLISLDLGGETTVKSLHASAIYHQLGKDRIR